MRQQASDARPGDILSTAVSEELAKNPTTMICPSCQQTFTPRGLPDLYHSPCCGAELDGNDEDREE